MDGIQRAAYGVHASELRRWYAFDIPLTGDALERATTDVEAAIARAADAVTCLLSQGVDQAMARYNG